MLATALLKASASILAPTAAIVWWSLRRSAGSSPVLSDAAGGVEGPVPAGGEGASPEVAVEASRHSRWMNRQAPLIPSSLHSRSRSGGESESMNQRTASAPY